MRRRELASLGLSIVLLSACQSDEAIPGRSTSALEGAGLEAMTLLATLEAGDGPRQVTIRSVAPEVGGGGASAQRSWRGDRSGRRT